MHSIHIKQNFIKRYQRYSLIKAFLSLLFYLRKDVRKTNINFFYVIFTFIFYFFGLLYIEINFFFQNIFNAIREKKGIQKLRKTILLNFNFLKKNTYIIPYPVNLNKKDLWLFEYLNFYYLKPSILVKVKNANLYIATEFGIVYKNFIINIKSIHGKWDKRNVKILKNYFEMIFTHHIGSEFKKEEDIILLNSDNNYLLIHNWFNYYHWITESLCRLINVKDDILQYTLVLPETLKSNIYVQSSLALFNNVQIKYVPNESSIKFNQLNFVSQKKYCDNYDPELLGQLKEYLINRVSELKIVSPIKNKNIFINRNKADRRSIINDEEVNVILKKYDFEIIDFEDYSFYEQIAISQNCSNLIGAHGSGLTNMIFMPAGSKVMELHRLVRNKKEHHSKVYWRLAGALKHKYYYQFCNIDPENDTFFTTNISIGIEEFENNLKLLLSDNGNKK